MNNLLFQISSFSFLFVHSGAIPVPNRPFGEKNAAFFGVLAFIGIGAVIGMCVFCKKKKDKFKKFENDGNIEEVKNTEYPIINSLNSLDTRNSGAIIPSSPTNLSTDNLLDQTVQDQNESVSTHELDGIENYHLLQYQTEHYSKTRSSFRVSDGDIPAKEGHVTPKIQKDDNDDLNSNMLLSSKESLSSALPIPTNRNNYSMEQGTISLNNSIEFEVNKPLIDRCATDVETACIDEEDYSGSMNMSAQPTIRLDDVTISISEKESCYDEPSSTATGRFKNHEGPEDVTPMDSLDDKSSVHETNSIEEALRALDIAIDGGVESDDSDGGSNCVDYSADFEIVKDGKNDPEHPNAMCNEKNSSSDSGMDEIDISEKVITPDIVFHEMVRSEAVKLVDEILLLCQSRIEEINECDEKEIFQTGAPAYDDFNDFNSGVVLTCSTPFVAKKSLELVKMNNKFEAKQALFCDVSEKMYVKADDIDALANTYSDIEDKHDQNEYALTTYNKPNVTYNFDENVANELEQIYPVNETVTISLIKSTTHFVDNHSDTFIKDQSYNLPNIMIDEAADDGVPGKATTTPMNTPIELGCSKTADWDRWLTASSTTCQIDDEDLLIQGQSNDDYTNHRYDDGWFLHSKPSCSKIESHNNDSVGNNTYDLDENGENLNSTYDLLRKHLAEMLPHAQGVKEAPECFEEFDISPNSFGIQYGTLDEATNAPTTSVAQNNEMIINYKRTLSPIMEESEDESFYNKTSYYKDASIYVQSTSTGCMESLTAIGVNKTLMASNDTLFNFEDVLDEILSPRIPSQSHTPTSRDKEIDDTFLRSLHHELSTTDSGTTIIDYRQLPKSLDFAGHRVQCSSLSSPGDIARIDFSQDSSFTLEEQTCISLSKANEEDERISEISEPILVSSSSGLNKLHEENNSLMDEDIVSLEEDSFDEILEKEKSLKNEQYNHFLDLHSTAAGSILILEAPEPDENVDPASNVGNVEQDTVLLQNKLNLATSLNTRASNEQVAIESIDRFLLKSRNISLPDEKSTNTLVNGHISSGKLSSRSDGKNFCINYDN